MDKNVLERKLVLVTGGGSGIGKECCKLAASMGGSVIIADINKVSAESTETEINKDSTNGAKHCAVQVDVSNAESVQELSEVVQKIYGSQPTVVVNSAGILGKPLILEHQTIEMWKEVIDVNLQGTFLVSQMFAKLMKEKGLTGSIVNISSIAKDGAAKLVPYSASKGGVCGLSKAIAQEFGPFNIRCNAVAPGAIDTPILQAGGPKSSFQNYVNSCAMKRIGRPEEVASVCIFLGSDASSYVNGVVLEVHGGRIIA